MSIVTLTFDLGNITSPTLFHEVCMWMEWRPCYEQFIFYHVSQRWHKLGRTDFLLGLFQCSFFYVNKLRYEIGWLISLMDPHSINFVKMSWHKWKLVKYPNHIGTRWSDLPGKNAQSTVTGDTPWQRARSSDRALPIYVYYGTQLRKRRTTRDSRHGSRIVWAK